MVIYGPMLFRSRRTRLRGLYIASYCLLFVGNKYTPFFNGKSVNPPVSFCSLLKKGNKVNFDMELIVNFATPF